MEIGDELKQQIVRAVSFKQLLQELRGAAANVAHAAIQTEPVASVTITLTGTVVLITATGNVIRWPTHEVR